MGTLLLSSRDCEKVDVSVPATVINLHPEEAWSQPAAADIHGHRLAKPQKTPRSIFLLTGDGH